MAKRDRNNRISPEELNKQFNYDPETGILTWKFSKKGRRTNQALGNLNSGGYLRVGVNYQEYLVHRIIWTMVKGEWPVTDIDHIDGVTTNNKWDNLRLATESQNIQNQKKGHKGSASKYLGVSRNWGSSWRAEICINRVNKHLGTFATEEEAYAAYLEAKRKLHITNTL